jgi:hypothetical protein
MGLTSFSNLWYSLSQAKRASFVCHEKGKKLCSRNLSAAKLLMREDT